MSSIIWSTFTEPVGDTVLSCDVRGGDGAGAGWSQGVAPLRLGGILVWVISESVLGPPSLGDKTRGVIGAWFARNRRDRSQNTAINKPSTRTPKMGPTIFPTVAACEELAQARSRSEKTINSSFGTEGSCILLTWSLTRWLKAGLPDR
jgi:hypothetical protein